MQATRGRLKIRPPRRGLVKEGEPNFEETWKILNSCLRDMHLKNASKLSYESIYRHAYRIVLKKEGPRLYEAIQQSGEDWLSLSVKQELATFLVPTLFIPVEVEAAATTQNEKRVAGEKFLRALNAAWSDQHHFLNMSTDVFMYLNRVYCTDNRKASIYVSGMEQFRKHILRDETSDPTLLEVARNIIFEQITMDRRGEIVERNLLKTCVDMLESIFETVNQKEEESLYLTAFEDPFLDASRFFYANEGTKLLNEADAASYCRHTLKRIHEERDRCRTTLSESTTERLTKVVEEEMIESRIDQLIGMETGVKQMIDQDRLHDLGLVYELNSRIDEKKLALTRAVQKGIAETGAIVNEAIMNLSAAKPANASAKEQETEKAREEAKPNINQQTLAALKWVDDILQLKDKYDHIWQQSFRADPIIQPALARSFTETINAFDRSSEFISLFIDENMKKGLKDKTEAEVDVVLEKAIVLLRYINNKDLFERYYKKHLCRRLLMGKTVSVDVEKQMIMRMKIELGNSFTSKLEGMFKDMDVSKNLTAGYRARTGADSVSSRTELGIHVLTNGTWPMETMRASDDNDADKKQCIFPPNVERIKTGFEQFYAEKHSGRKLTWMGNMGTADVRATYPKVPGKDGRLAKERKYEVNVSTYAMIILMLFNDLPTGESLSFDEIQAKTNIGSNELIRNLQSIAVAQGRRILVKEPMSKDVKPTDRFLFNDSFQSPYMRFKAGVVTATNRIEGDKERMETEQKNNDSRGFVIEAAIVRIMKQRKELSHQQLVAETLTQLASQFKPDVTMIKRRIESLIEREYLERIGESSNYRYLA